jgi:hypothetical protein
MLMYDQARQRLLQVQEEYGRLLQEFAGSKLLDAELNSVETRFQVLEAYDELAEIRTGIYSELLSAESEVTMARVLRSYFESVRTDWLRYSSDRFVDTCQALYTNCLWVVGHLYESESIEKARSIFRLKNSNYSNTFLTMGVPGIFTRLSDKFARYETLVKRASADGAEGDVGDEGPLDTLIDAANYALMAGICHKFSRGAALLTR